eukprot:TRINITY_DN3270_c0_g1_i1.p1 TRINITY_DN3270_c0_g1~~TRINITY_DN3270_c0_g1_i1.p1  ORF type:complete len:318 (+),score=79.91 TRINITY_DN3270_c0_g1_i1:86-1039(+)
MGQLLTYLSSGKEAADIFLDFENAKPESKEEQDVHGLVAAVLDKGPEILRILTTYHGCEEFIRKAITSPSPDTEDAAWKAVLPAVEQLKVLYDFSQELEAVVPKLLAALCKSNPKNQLASQQALAKQLADVFDFVLRFDDAKMVNPSIQNDFSYYRRTLNRMKITRTDSAPVTIRDELANRMSLFFAYPTPMMNVINESTGKLLANDPTIPRENVTTALATMANVCCDMVEKKKFEKPDLNMFCLRAMTSSIILYDHLHAPGAFGKKSTINVKACITTLRGYTAVSTDGLLNALRFTTVHLNDPDTPAAIKHLLEGN